MSNPFSDITIFAPTWLYITTKDSMRQKLKLNPVQLQIHNNTTGRDLILKPRQKGVSTYIQAELFRLAVTKTVNTATISHEDKTTQRLRRMVDGYYDGLISLICSQYGVDPTKLTPKQLEKYPIPKREYANSTLTTYSDFKSESFIVTAGNLQTGRGGTYSHVHGSEIAFWKDPQKIVSGLMQGGNPKIWLESTPNGAQGYYYDLCMEVLEQNKDWQKDLKLHPYVDGLDWRLHFFTWWFDDEYQTPLEPDEIIIPSGDSIYGLRSELELVEKHGITLPQIKWRRRKIREVKHEFPQEYPEDIIECFLLSGMGYFGDIRKCLLPDDFSPQFNENDRYYAGLDFGQANDYTALSIIDKDTRQQVASLRLNRLDWSEMRRQVRLLCDKWHVRFLLAETNSMGTVNIEELKKEFSREKSKTKVLEFQTTNLSKAEIMSNLHEGMHEMGLKLLPDKIQQREIQAYTRKYTETGIPKLTAPEDEHDDTVIALALSWHCAMVMGRKLIH